ncbi:MAG: hypothetical protein IJU87_03325 [Lachnospiraceae bacterium]|nr:hypothetical protein [Lachnospiraceae bacterium]
MMNVNSVNLYKSVGAAGTAGYAAGVKYVPSDRERQEKLSKIDERANGGVSRDGDTVSISSEGSSLSKMYEVKGKNSIDFLKEDSGNMGGIAETISASSEKLGISKEINENRARQAEIDTLKENIETAAPAGKEETAAKADTNSTDSADLTRYSANELKEMFEDGNITTAAYRSEMEDRRTNRAGDTEEQEKPENNEVPAARRVTEDTRSEQTGNVNSGNDNVREAEERLENIQEKNADKLRAERKAELEEVLSDVADRRRAEVENARLDNEQENAQAARAADKELYNVAYSFQESPYDVTSSIKEMEEDESAIGINRIEVPEAAVRNTPEAVNLRTAAPEVTEEAEELENVMTTVNTENVEASVNTQNIEAAANTAAQATIDENAVNNRVTVQEVA